MAPNFAALPLPDLVRAALIEAQKNLAAGKYAEAEPLLWDVLRADSRNHAALHLLSRLGLQFGDFLSAEVLAEKAIALNAREADYHVTLGRIRRGQQRHAEAESCLRVGLRFAQSRATRANAEVLLGLTLKAQGRIDEAIASYRKALQLQPGFPEASLNLANALRESGQADEAAALYRDVAAANPQFPAAQGALAAALMTEGRHAEALEQYRRALELLPEQPGMQFVVGWLNAAQGDLAASIAAYRRAVEHDPGYADAWVNLGLALAESGQAQASLDCFVKAIQAEPGHVEAHVNFAAGLAGFGLTGPGLAVLRRAWELRPDDPAVLSNLGAVLIQGSKPEEAAVHLRRALSLDPASAQALVNLGMALRGPGVQGESIALLRRGLALGPDDPYSHSNLLLSLCYAGGVGPGEILEASRAFGTRPFAHPGGAAFCDPERRIEPEPSRRLRIGYVSPDFRTHSVSYFVEPVLQHHDRTEFEVFCYSVSALEDETTLRLKSRADHWRSCYSMPDAALAQLVREDSIDVLVDLAGHTAQHRLTAFALKPAPVQMTWLGYPSTVGLPAIDYRISDPYVDPVGYEQFNSETLLRLPGSYFCYRPGPAPEVGPLPGATQDPITFGSFNALPKVSDETVALWARVLCELPGSRLVVKTRLLAEAPARERVSAAFAAAGVAPERVELIAWEDTAASHLETYNRIDIALDTFPFNGATTTCEALWMGVPVVSLCGDTHASRMGRSILSAVGLPHLVAESHGSFAEIAASLATDRVRLAALRAGMRDRLRGAALFREEEFTRAMESLYRTAWRRWCFAHA